MSNALAINAVTATLRNLLDKVTTDLPDTAVTAKPLDKARDNESLNQVNLFLYRTMANAAWRNMDMAPQVKPGETGQQPMALDLFYLLTVYGKDNNDMLAHRVLGQAMSILYDHPVLGRTEVRDALAGNDLHEQVERVRIIPYDLSLEDLFKLWSAFHSGYRLSVAYQVSVVLIESRRPVRIPLPVLTRQVTANPRLSPPAPPFPVIQSVLLPHPQQLNATLGDTLTIQGHHLTGDVVNVQFTTPRLDTPIDVSPEAGGMETALQVQLPNDAAAHAAWPAGSYQVAVVVTPSGQPTQTRTRNP